MRILVAKNNRKAAETAERNGREAATNPAWLPEDKEAAALAALAAAWETLPPDEQVRLVPRLVERVDYDGAAGQMSVTFHAAGIHALAQEWTRSIQENKS